MGTPNTETAWSIPPHAVPSYRSNLINDSINAFVDIELFRLFANKAVIPEHTTRAADDDKPDAIGTLPFLKEKNKT